MQGSNLLKRKKKCTIKSSWLDFQKCMRRGPCIYSIQKKKKLCCPKKMRRNLWYNWLVVKQFSFTWQPDKCSWCFNLLQRNTQIIKQIERRQRGTERSNKWLGRKINKNKERVPKCWLGEFARMFKLSRLIVGSMTYWFGWKNMASHVSWNCIFFPFFWVKTQNYHRL